MDMAAQEEPLFGMEQEYLIMDGKLPYGWEYKKFHQGPYYCGIGAEVSWGRRIMEEHLRACLHAGVKIAGTNSEVMIGQWEYQVGVCKGIELGDHVWMSRYILERIAIHYGLSVSYTQKMYSDWNGNAGHLNFSFKSSREDISIIKEYTKGLQERHFDLIEIYGEGVKERLCGHHETQHWAKFSYGCGDRG